MNGLHQDATAFLDACRKVESLEASLREAKEQLDQAALQLCLPDPQRMVWRTSPFMIHSLDEGDVVVELPEEPWGLCHNGQSPEKLTPHIQIKRLPETIYSNAPPLTFEDFRRGREEKETWVDGHQHWYVYPGGKDIMEVDGGFVPWSPDRNGPAPSCGTLEEAERELYRFWSEPAV